MMCKSPGGEPGLGQNLRLVGRPSIYSARAAAAIPDPIARPIDGARQ
jgi:hypothetical protein